jgi:hypothetical protein
VARRTAARLVKVLKKHGRQLDPERGEVDVSAGAMDDQDSALASCYAAAARGHGPVRRAGGFACAVERFNNVKGCFWPSVFGVRFPLRFLCGAVQI